MLRRRLFACSTMLLSLCLTANPALAAWPNDANLGGVAVSAATGDQDAHVVVSDGAGGVIAVWRDARSGTSDVYAQRIDVTGAVRWTINGVAVCTATNNQQGVAITSDGSGGAIIAWQDFRSGTQYDVYAQRVSAAGAIQWTANGVLVGGATNNQTLAAITSDGVGGAIIAWSDLRSGVSDIYAQRLNSAGAAQWTANGVPLCTAGDSQSSASLCPDGAGGAIAVWLDGRSTTNDDVYAQRVNASGVAVWTANGVALCTAATSQYSLVAVADGAGGAIATWVDERSIVESDIYAQRISGAGVPLWSSNGAVVCAATNNQVSPEIASDGLGGGIIAWADYRGGSSGDVYAQRLNAGGDAQWTANGLAVCTAADNQIAVSAVADGAGGVIIGWTDWRGGLRSDAFAQRVSGAGVAQWTANGVALGSVAGNQNTPFFGSDGNGGAIGVWVDFRSLSNDDLYAQRVERYGRLGNPEPTITSVGDVKNDQGGFVKVVWSASYLDADPTYGITEYRVFRSVPGAALASALAAGRATTTDSDEAVREGKLLVTPNGATATSWEFVGTQAAEAFATYSKVVATTADSVGGSNPRTFFMVEARASTSISSDRWSSAPDSGYSVDNLAPAAPAPLTGQYAAGTTQLHWNRNTEADLAGYRLYRGSNAAFVPSPSNFVAALPDTGAADAAGAPYVYKLTAVDVHGNESPVATLIPSGTLGVDGGATRAALSFAAPSPNPARGSATLRFSLSRAGAVRVNVYDAAGRCVATPVDGALEAGEHTAAFALRDGAGRELPAGLYLARLEAEGRTITRRIVATH